MMVRRIMRGVPCHGVTRTKLATVQADIAEINERLAANQMPKAQDAGGSDVGEPGVNDLQVLVMAAKHLGTIMEHYTELFEHFVLQAADRMEGNESMQQHMSSQPVVHV